RVLFVRLVAASADQVGVFIRFEIGQSHDHRFGVERRGERRDAFGELFDVKFHRPAIACDPLCDHALDVVRLALELEQRFRMNADHAIDDELEARQADALVRQPLKIEGAFRIADVHHDLYRNRRHLSEVDVAHFEIEPVLIYHSGFTFGARHRHRHSGSNDVGRVAAADHRRNAEFARHDGGMTGTTAAVRDDDLAGFDLIELGGALNDARVAGADARADGTPRYQHLAALFQAEALQHVVPRAAAHGFGTRLQYVELAVEAVFAPFDVHRPAVVFFDDER